MLYLGKSSRTSSGNIFLYTADSASTGVSGDIEIFTGLSNRGDSGYVAVNTGVSLSGKAGDIDVLVGAGNSGQGGDIYMIAGETSMNAKTGGRVQITGGLGSASPSGFVGGFGGKVQINGGEAKGLSSTNTGGDVSIVGGTAAAGTGGALYLVTGFGVSTSSGEILLSTMNAGTRGVSGKISLVSSLFQYFDICKMILFFFTGYWNIYKRKFWSNVVEYWLRVQR
jgi:hypothetical protein